MIPDPDIYAEPASRGAERALQWFLANWKTNASGLLLLALAALEMAGVQVAGVTATPGALVIQAAIAFGLISAKDAGQ